MRKGGIVIKASRSLGRSDDKMAQFSKNNNLFCGFKVSSKTSPNGPAIPDDIRRLIDDAKNTVAWTPPEDTVKKVVEHFLLTEPSWLDATVRRDPALYKHMDLDKETLGKFRGTNGLPPSLNLKDLVEAGKISENTLDEIESEVKSYQGLHAIAFHRIAHAFYTQYEDKKQQAKALNKPKDDPEVSRLRSEAAADLLFARNISQGVRRLTAGIEIHPGAKIGSNFFIDHGTGIVIGETAEVGNNVHFYHNITLGAASGKEVDEGSPIPRRHPKIGDNVTISNNVNILGPVLVENNVSIGTSVVIKHIHSGNRPTIIGHDANIRDGAIITRDVAPDTHVIGTMGALPGMTNDLYGELIIKDPQSTKAHSLPFTMVAPETVQKIGRVLNSLLPGRGAA